MYPETKYPETKYSETKYFKIGDKVRHIAAMPQHCIENTLDSPHNADTIFIVTDRIKYAYDDEICYEIICDINENTLVRWECYDHELVKVEDSSDQKF